MKAFVISIFLSFYLFAALGQRPEGVEKELIHQLGRIGYWSDLIRDANNEYAYDSLLEVNRIFQKNLIKFTKDHPESISGTFTELQDVGLHIVTSPDGLFRIYSWDTWTGGSMHVFENVYQYKAGDKVFCKTIGQAMEVSEPGYYYSDVYSVNKGDTTCYLAIYNAIHSNKDCYQGVKCFTIKGTILDDKLRLIKTATGIKNLLGFEYDFFSVVEQHEERPIKLMTYDPQLKIISFPVVTKGGAVTKGLITYSFDGKYFTRNK